MFRRGYRTMFRSESFPSCCQAAACAYGPRLRLQTGLCMPYGLWLWVASQQIINVHACRMIITDRAV